MSRANQADQYVFTFNPSGEVTSVAEVERNGRLDYEKIEKDESYRLVDGLVLKSERDDGQTEWTVYGDTDGDGFWTELGEGEGAPDLSLFTPTAGTETPVKQVLDDDAHVFQFDAAGLVTAVFELERNGRLEREHVDADETYTLVNGFVVKTEVDDGQVEQTTYSDADGDGIWHAVIVPEPTSLWDGATLM